LAIIGSSDGHIIDGAGSIIADKSASISPAKATPPDVTLGCRHHRHPDVSHEEDAAT